MRTAEQILKDEFGFTEAGSFKAYKMHSSYEYQSAIDAINVARKEALEEAAKAAVEEYQQSGNDQTISDSILKLISDLK